MNHIVKYILAALVVAAATVCSGLAFAGDASATAILQAATTSPDGHAVTYQDALVYIIALIGGACAAAGAYLSNLFFGSKGKVPLSVENKTAVDHAIAVGIANGTKKLQSLAKELPDINIDNEIVAHVVSFVTASTPTALNALGLTPEKLEEYVREKLHLQTDPGTAPDA